MLRILLIEDDPEAARYVSRGLREAGHLADTADNGPDGLALAASESYDLLVIDRMLPAMDGLSVIANLRDLDNHTPVLILSALGDLEDRVTGLRAGGDDYLPKPFAFEELLARVEALGRRAQHSVMTTQFKV
ncbi:MAG: response regulator, partial [Acidiferrobacteraceae bacterium]|nr:response regulator [Acidiferrobacteraceae bacterium]